MSSIRNLISQSILLSAAIVAGGCGSNSPTSPSTSGVNVSSVVLASTTIGVGGTTQGTVTLAAAPSAAVSVTLTSSSTSVATVASPVTVAAGATTATFTVTGVGAGTTSISAVTGGAAGQSTLTVVRVALATLSLSGTTVVGGVSLTGTVTLTAPAPVGGAAVTITATDPLSAPATVTVPAGASTAVFTVTSRLVGGTLPGSVTASYGGASSSATVSVTKPTVATASFGVTGPTESDTCTMGNGGNTLNCTFNGSTSTAPGTIVGYDWSFKAGSATAVTQTTTGAILAQPAVSCAWLPPPPLPAGGPTWLTLTVTLTVRDDQGNVSVLATNNGGARVFPQGVCGY